MNENNLVELIKSLTQSSYIGDDCAFLEDLGITVSQDSLVEDVHFRLSWMSAKELGQKTALVNISDIIASGAVPAYMTISLSLPQQIGRDFVKDFYTGVMKVCDSFGVKVIGGDLTGSDKVYVSATIIGKTNGRGVASRSFATPGFNIWVFGEHGSSAAGLRLLENGLSINEKYRELVNAHKVPVLCRKIPTLNTPFAMMDTSDGLADALFKIAESSNVTLVINFEKIPFNQKIKMYDDYENLILFGGEDYGLVVALPPNEILESFTKIGYVSSRASVPLVVNKAGKSIELASIDKFVFKHF